MEGSPGSPMDWTPTAPACAPLSDPFSSPLASMDWEPIQPLRPSPPPLRPVAIPYNRIRTFQSYHAQQPIYPLVEQIAHTKNPTLPWNNDLFGYKQPQPWLTKKRLLEQLESEPKILETTHAQIQVHKETQAQEQVQPQAQNHTEPQAQAQPQPQVEDEPSLAAATAGGSIVMRGINVFFSHLARIVSSLDENDPDTITVRIVTDGNKRRMVESMHVPGSWPATPARTTARPVRQTTSEPVTQNPPQAPVAPVGTFTKIYRAFTNILYRRGPEVAAQATSTSPAPLTSPALSSPRQQTEGRTTSSPNPTSRQLFPTAEERSSIAENVMDTTFPSNNNLGNHPNDTITTPAPQGRGNVRPLSDQNSLPPVTSTSSNSSHSSISGERPLCYLADEFEIPEAPPSPSPLSENELPKPMALRYPIRPFKASMITPDEPNFRKPPRKDVYTMDVKDMSPWTKRHSIRAMTEEAERTGRIRKGLPDVILYAKPKPSFDLLYQNSKTATMSVGKSTNLNKPAAHKMKLSEDDQTSTTVVPEKLTSKFETCTSDTDDKEVATTVTTENNTIIGVNVKQPSDLATGIAFQTPKNTSTTKIVPGATSDKATTTVELNVQSLPKVETAEAVHSSKIVPVTETIDNELSELPDATPTKPDRHVHFNEEYQFMQFHKPIPRVKYYDTEGKVGETPSPYHRKDFKQWQGDKARASPTQSEEATPDRPNNLPPFPDSPATRIFTPRPRPTTGSPKSPSIEELIDGVEIFGLSKEAIKKIELKREAARKAAQIAAELEKKRIEEEKRKLEEEKQKREELARKEAREAQKKLTIIKELTPEWESKVSQALRSKSPTSVVAGGLTRKDFGTLLPQSLADGIGWLNDEIVNTYLAKLVEKGLEQTKYNKRKADSVPEYHAFSTHLYSTYNNPSKGWKAVWRWAHRAKIGFEKILQTEKVFIPINDHSHWTLIAISGKNRTIEYYDSMNGNPKKYTGFAMSWLSQVIPEEFWKPEEWKIVDVSSLQQANALDCGVFVCMNALALMQGRMPHTAFKTAEMQKARKMVAATIINGGFSGDFDIDVDTIHN